MAAVTVMTIGKEIKRNTINRFFLKKRARSYQ